MKLTLCGAEVPAASLLRRYPVVVGPLTLVIGIGVPAFGIVQLTSA